MISRVKKFFVAVVVFSLFSFIVVSESNSNKIKLQTSLYVPSTVVNEYFNIAGEYDFSIQRYELLTGLAVNNQQFNCTVKNVYYPLEFDGLGNLKKLNFGVSQVLHYKRLYGASNQIDCLFGVQSNLEFQNIYLNAAVHFLSKFSFVDGVTNKKVVTFDPAFDFLLGFYLNQKLTMELGLSSWTFHRINRLCTPTCSFLLNQKLNDLIKMDYSIKFNGIDIFTLSSFWEDTEFSVGVELCF